MTRAPEQFSIELEHTKSGWWWAFVCIDGKAIAAGFAKNIDAAVSDVLVTAERYGWRNPWHAPTDAERAGAS